MEKEPKQYPKDQPVMNFKTCYSCSSHLPSNATHCFSCKKRVGPIDRHGYARRPFDWKAYGLCIFSWGLFAFYIWWGFFREK